MDMRKVILSSIAMAMFFAGSLGLFILVACSGPKPVSEEGTQEEVETVIPEEIDLDTLDVVIAEEPEVITSSKKEQPRVRQRDCDDDTTPLNRRSNSCLRSPHSKQPSASVYSGDPNSEEEGDYWSEKRKRSPNDNYLLGFDEDVDDVHDMELYIEDY